MVASDFSHWYRKLSLFSPPGRADEAAAIRSALMDPQPATLSTYRTSPPLDNSYRIDTTIDISDNRGRWPY